MDHDVRVVNLGGDVFALSTDWLARAPFIEDVVGQIVAEAGAILLCDGAYEDSITVEELQVDGEGVRVVRVVEEQRV